MRVSPARGPVPLVGFRSPRSDPMVLEDYLRSAVLSVTEPSVTRAFMVSSEPGQHKRRAQPASRESRLTGLQAPPTGRRITDPRVAAPPPARALGEVPAEMAGIANEAFAELGLAALVLAGGGSDTAAWVVARCWADLDRGGVLDPGHRFPALGIAALVTATAALRLIADGRVGLDSPASECLRVVRLADDTITVRELLSHTAGVDSPAPAELFADTVPDLVTLAGPVIACSGTRGVVRPSNGGYAVLGQLIADVTGSPYRDA